MKKSETIKIRDLPFKTKLVGKSRWEVLKDGEPIGYIFRSGPRHYYGEALRVGDNETWIMNFCTYGKSMVLAYLALAGFEGRRPATPEELHNFNEQLNSRSWKAKAWAFI